MPRNEKETQELVDSEIRLRHMEDVARSIDAREDAVHAAAAPYTARKLRNHFTQEYDELWKGNRR